MGKEVGKNREVSAEYADMQNRALNYKIHKVKSV